MKNTEFENKTILMIDDDEYNHIYIETVLKDTGCNLISSYDSCDGVKQFKIHTVDLVLLDINLPKANGYDILKKLKKINPDIDVIMITAEKDYVDISYERGALAYLIKPISPKKLKEVMRMTFTMKKLVNI